MSASDISVHQPDAAPGSQGFARGATMGFVGMVYSQVATLAAGILIARVIGAADYGIANIARMILLTLSVIAPLGLDLALQRYLGSGQNQLSRRLHHVRVFRVGAFALAAAPAFFVAVGLGNEIEESIYRYPDFANILLVTLVALPFATDLAVLGGAYRGVFRPEPSLVVSFILQPTLRILLILVLFAMGWRLWAVVTATSASVVLSWALLAIRARRDFSSTEATPKTDWADVRSVLSYSPSLAAALAIFASLRAVDSLVLGYFGTATDVGQYGAVLIITQLVGLFGTAIGQTLGAGVAARHDAGDLAGMEELLKKNIRWTTLFSAPMFAMVIFWGDRIDLLLGPSFTVDARVVAIAAATQLMISAFACTGFALSMTGRQGTEVRILAIGLFVALLMSLALIPYFGQIGAACASFIALTVMNLLRYQKVISTFRIHPVRPDALVTILAATFAAAGVYLVSQPLDGRSLVATAGACLVFAAVYSAVAWTLLLSNDERTEIIMWVERRFPRIGIGRRTVRSPGNDMSI